MAIVTTVARIRLVMWLRVACLSTLVSPSLQATGLQDTCGVEGEGFAALASSCAEGVAALPEDEGGPPPWEDQSYGYCFGHFMLVAEVEITLANYIDEIEPLLQSAALDSNQWKVIKALREPATCLLCLRSQCLGDDLALRAYIFGFRARLSLDIVAALPSIYPEQYTWSAVAQDESRRPVLHLGGKAHPHGLPPRGLLRAAIVTRANSAFLGGSFLFNEKGKDGLLSFHMGGLFEQVVGGALWKMKFSIMQQLFNAAELLEQW